MLASEELIIQKFSPLYSLFKQAEQSQSWFTIRGIQQTLMPFCGTDTVREHIHGDLSQFWRPVRQSPRPAYYQCIGISKYPLRRFCLEQARKWKGQTIVWPIDKLTEQVQRLEQSLAFDQRQRQEELASVTQALAQHRTDTSTEMATRLSDLQQSLEASMRKLQLPADFSQMLRTEFFSRMSSLESSMQTLLQSFIATQREVQQLNTLLAQLPNELETLHTQFRGALSRDREVFKNELHNTLPTQIPYSDDLIEQFNREFAQLRIELLTALAARAPITEPIPSLALTPFDGQRPADEQVSERLVPVFKALVALEADIVAWVAQQKADVHTSADFLIEHLQVLKTRVYPSQPPALPPSNGSEAEQVEQPEQQITVVEEAQES